MTIGLWEESEYCIGVGMFPLVGAHRLTEAQAKKEWRTMYLLSEMAQPFKIGSCPFHALTINNDRPSRMVDVRRFSTPGSVLVSGAKERLQ